jgi:hypothetical protein
MVYSAYLTVLVISLLSSITVYFQINAPRYLRFFLYLLATTLAVEMTARYLNPNTPLYNLYTVFEFVFYFAVLEAVITSRRVKNRIRLLIWVYPSLALINIFFVQRIYTFHSITYALGSLLILIVSIYYFFELFQMKQPINLVREPSFWICSGLLFYYSCTFPIFGYFNFFIHAPKIIIYNGENIVLILNILMYLLFTIALLCRIKARNSMLSR